MDIQGDITSDETSCSSKEIDDTNFYCINRFGRDNGITDSVILKNFESQFG